MDSRLFPKELFSCAASFSNPGQFTGKWCMRTFSVNLKGQLSHKKDKNVDRMNYLRIQILMLLLGVVHVTFGQQVKKTWTKVKPFEQRLFIEGKGQFHPETNELKPGDILFYARFDGLQYYFTKNSIWISRSIKVKRNPLERIWLEMKISKENKGREKENEEEERREKEILRWKKKELFQCMKFSGASSNVVVEGLEEVTQRFNYGTKEGVTIHSKAYRKIYYQQVYPGIDMEIFFPEDKQGFKYNLLIHPGADAGQIAIHYPFNKGLQLDAENNLRIHSLFGEFTEHTPKAWQDNEPVVSTFALKNKMNTFQVGPYDRALPLVIDPWIITPVFETPNNDRAYDVDWDTDGNCYVHGGTESSFLPYEVLKFDKAGNPLWTYVGNELGDFYFFYGDFAVDRESQSVYVSGGAHYGGSNSNYIAKLDKDGSLLSGLGFQDTMMVEIWRVAHNCTEQLVMVGGGLTLPVAHTTYVDTNLQSVKVIDIFNDSILGYDAWGLTTDKNGNCYVGYMAPAFSPVQKVFNNLVKLPLPSFGPINWITPSGYKFMEGRCYSFHVSGNGYNGMCMSNNKLLTYDASVLKKWDPGNGALQDSISVKGFSRDTIDYGGLTADDCDHIFLAKDTIILQYNAASMKPDPANTFIMPGMIYDLALGNDNILYACGDRFVSAMEVNLPLCNPLITTHHTIHADCGKTGSDSVSVSGGSPPYTFKWNTVPVQTGTTAVNLFPGTYVVTIRDSSCPRRIKKDTVIISGGDELQANTQVTSILCNGGTGTISVNVIKGSKPYTYTWGPVAGNDSILKNVSAGVYTIMIKDSKGCSYTDTITLAEPLPINLKITKTDEQCDNGGGSITVEPSGGIPPYSFTWNNGNAGNSLAQLKAGTYSVNVQDANGCSKKFAIDIGNNMSQTPDALFVYSPLVTDMTTPLIHFQDQSKGAVKWYWNFGDGAVDSVRHPSHSYKEGGIYTITLDVVNALGCKSTYSISVTIYPLWSFYIPNSFTPNGDEVNDTFNGKGEYIKDYSMLIFNRWGEQIFSTNNLEKGWDGKVAGSSELAQEDVYLYLVILRDVRGKEHRYQGIVSLIK